MFGFQHHPWRLAIFLTLGASSTAITSECFYPDGNVANDGYACQGDSSMCCPDQWQCLDNGICHYPAEDLYQRCSCTDKEWGDSCPQYCVRSVSSMGNEAVLQCKDGTWCCDTNHPEFSNGKSCCEQGAQKVSFDFGLGIIFAEISASSAVATTGLLSLVPQTRTSRRESASSSSSLSSDSVAGSDTTDAGSPLYTSRQTTLTSMTTTAFSSSTPESNQADTTDSPQAPAHAKDIGTVIGAAIAVPITVIALGVIAWLLWAKRSKTKDKRRSGQVTPYDFRQNAEATAKEEDSASPHCGGDIGQVTPLRAPSEIDSREVRIPIRPMEVTDALPRDLTTDTLYPAAFANSSMAAAASPISPYGPPDPLSPPGSRPSSNQDFSMWSVSPHIRQNRWSGTTALESSSPPSGLSSTSFPTVSTGVSPGSITVDSTQPAEGTRQMTQEIMGRPRIPSTIAELPG